MTKTQKTTELWEKPHEKNTIILINSKRILKLENTKRLERFRIGEPLTTDEPRNLLRWGKENHCVWRNTKPRYIFSFQTPCAAPAKNQNKTAL